MQIIEKTSGDTCIKNAEVIRDFLKTVEFDRLEYKNNVQLLSDFIFLV